MKLKLKFKKSDLKKIVLILGKKSDMSPKLFYLFKKKYLRMKNEKFFDIVCNLSFLSCDFIEWTVDGLHEH